MANQKYDNLQTMLSQGRLNWNVDNIVAVLMTGATFDATDAVLSDLGVGALASVQVPGRSVAADGTLLGLPVVFNSVAKDTPLQVIFCREDGVSSVPLAWFDSDENDAPMTLKNNGTFTMRPTPVPDASPPQLGTWVTF